MDVPVTTNMLSVTTVLSRTQDRTQEITREDKEDRMFVAPEK